MAKGQRKKRAGAGWRRRFLAGLARTANARLAAEMAGVDHGAAYQLRQRDSGFAAAWVRAREWGRARVAAEGRAVHSGGRPRASVGGGCGGSDGAEARPLVVRESKREGTQVVRAGEGRWCQAAEDLFLANLAANANVRAAARAAGFSTTALYARRMNDPAFSERWDAAKAQGAARIELHLIHTVDRALDPALVEAADDLPKPSIAEAIQIVRLFQVGASGGGAGGKGGGKWRAPPPRPLGEVRDGILAKLSAFDRAMTAGRLAEGWVRDEAGNWIPPGWERSGGGGRRGGAPPGDPD